MVKNTVWLGKRRNETFTQKSTFSSNLQYSTIQLHHPVQLWQHYGSDAHKALKEAHPTLQFQTRNRYFF